MIEEEMLAILHGAEDHGESLNRLVDEFRRGRSVEELLTLLDSRNSELASLGAWILGELPAALYDAPRFTLRLRQLLDHGDAAVRFQAFGALFPTLDLRSVSTRSLVERLQCDSNEGVRRSAAAAAAQVNHE